MSKFDYSRARATATKLITRFGQDAQLLVPSVASGNPWDPVPAAPAAYNVTIAITDYSEYDRRGTLIQAGDRRAFMSATGLTVTEEQLTAAKLVVNGTTLAVVNALPLNPAGVAVMYELQVRR